MNKILTTVAALLFSFSVSAQGWHPVAGKKDNQVMATTPATPADAFKAIQQHLIENNYNIEKADEGSLYLTATAPLGNGGLASGQYRLNIFIKAEDSTRAYIQGTYGAAVNGALAGPGMNFSGEIMYSPAKKSVIGLAFGSMTATAKAVPGASIRYRIKPKQ